MRSLGVHLSISGGMHHALEKAHELRIQAVQIFLKNSNRWIARPYSDEDIQLFKAAKSRFAGITIFAHTGYLINCAGEGDTLAKSIQALDDELNRAALLGIEHLVLHPGSHGGRGIEAGINRIVETLNRVLEKKLKTTILLETTAGQGASIGYRFEHLASIIDRVVHKNRVGVCLDTCHVFAAGYDISDKKTFTATIKEFNSTIGLERLHLIHINDSKKECGSRVDRHEHIGKGCIGMSGFKLLLNSSKLKKVPCILETPKFDDDKADRQNLRVIRSLVNS